MLGDVLTGPSGAFVLGVGVATAATAEEVVSLAQRALDAAGAAWAEVAAVATVEGRRHHPAIAALGLPVVAFPAAALHQAAAARPAGGTLRAAADPRPAGGHPPVAEAAALLAGGAGAVLVVPKRKSARVTVAVARAAPRLAGGPPRDEREA